ncbi:hypothetical protein PIB30_095935, partial [Stylosanthes scabra]|nr:hypothetical protein [Stylosanthes scabra]
LLLKSVGRQAGIRWYAHDRRKVIQPPGSAAHIVLPETSAGTKRPAQPSPMTSGHIGQDPPIVATISCELENLKRLGTTYHL